MAVIVVASKSMFTSIKYIKDDKLFVFVFQTKHSDSILSVAPLSFANIVCKKKKKKKNKMTGLCPLKKQNGLTCDNISITSTFCSSSSSSIDKF